MVWIILFFIILISSVLAYRSMRDYEEFPDSLNLNSVYYIGNSQSLTLETLKKLHNFFLSQNHFFSLEKLIKGKEKALVLYGPRDLGKTFLQLNLVEIEDYLGNEGAFGMEDVKKVNINQALSWLIEPKNNPKKMLHVGEELRDLKLEETQKVFIQVVLMPVGNLGGAIFQSTLRVMVAEIDSIKRVELAKKISQTIAASTGLNKHQDNFPESKKFDSFKQRSLIPKEIEEFTLSAGEVLNLVG